MVRIKNRLDPCYDSALSSGYRDVMINICIKTPETTSLRVQHHVAELQLILREVYECCTTPGTHSENVFSIGTLYSTYARPLTFQNVVPHHTRRTPDVCPLPQSPRPIVVCARGVGEGAGVGHSVSASGGEDGCLTGVSEAVQAARERRRWVHCADGGALVLEAAQRSGTRTSQRVCCLSPVTHRMCSL